MSDYTLKLWIQCQTLLESAKANLRKLETGQGMVEYALIIGLVGVAAMLVLFQLGGQVNLRFQEILDCIQAAPGGVPADCTPS